MAILIGIWVPSKKEELTQWDLKSVFSGFLAVILILSSPNNITILPILFIYVYTLEISWVKFLINFTIGVFFSLFAYHIFIANVFDLFHNFQYVWSFINKKEYQTGYGLNNRLIFFKTILLYFSMSAVLGYFWTFKKLKFGIFPTIYIKIGLLCGLSYLIAIYSESFKISNVFLLLSLTCASVFFLWNLCHWRERNYIILLLLIPIVLSFGSNISFEIRSSFYAVFYMGIIGLAVFYIQKNPPLNSKHLQILVLFFLTFGAIKMVTIYQKGMNWNGASLRNNNSVINIKSHGTIQGEFLVDTATLNQIEILKGIDLNGNYCVTNHQKHWGSIYLKNGVMLISYFVVNKLGFQELFSRVVTYPKDLIYFEDLKNESFLPILNKRYKTMKIDNKGDYNIYYLSNLL